MYVRIEDLDRYMRGKTGTGLPLLFGADPTPLRLAPGCSAPATVEPCPHDRGRTALAQAWRSRAREWRVGSRSIATGTRSGETSGQRRR
jgi:hypothetical protein